MYGDWLYWNVRRCDIDYAVPFSETANLLGQLPIFDSIGSVKTVCTDYESGYRLGLLKSCGDIDFRIHYTHYQADDTNKATGDLAGTYLNKLNSAILLNERVVQFAKADYDLEYDVVDVEVGYDLDFGRCTQACLFGGFKYANICQDLDIIYSDEEDGLVENARVDKFKTNVDMDAYGVYLGTAACYSILDCINLFGNFSYGALVGEFDQRFKHSETEDFDTNPFRLDTNLNNDCWKLVSNLNLTLGLEYKLATCFCADWVFAVGYEFHQWFCTLDFMKVIADLENLEDDTEGPGFTRTVRIVNNDSCMGFDGLFFRLSASF